MSAIWKANSREMIQAGDSIGPYTLVRTLGRGAFGEVWLAERRSSLLTTQVALKLPHDATADLATISGEAHTWLKASGHPNIVPVLDAEVYDGQVVIASEYISGGSLADWLSRHGGKAPSVETALAMMRGILDGLQHLHEIGLIHRDLKPENILIQKERPRLTDFGLTRVLKSTGRASSPAGTPGYMAPEVFQGHYSPASDIWAAGAVLHELLAGLLPYPESEFYPLLLAITSDQPVALSKGIPDDLVPVLARALAKPVSERFSSVAELCLALTNARDAISRLHAPLPALRPSNQVAPAMPSGTVTFLFTDIVGSTRLWEEHPDAMHAALKRHDQLLRQAIETHKGMAVKSTGDGVLAVFDTALDGVAAALEIQHAMFSEPWPEQTPIRVRAALHMGTAEYREGDYYGGAVNRAARLLATGHGGQVLLSQAVHELVRDRLPAGVGVQSLGEHRLQSLGRPEHIFQLIHPDLPSEFEPLRSLDSVAPLKAQNPEGHNLPLQSTPYIGRAEEIAGWLEMLRHPATRLVTLVGFGGIGKSRAALLLAQQSLEDFEDGAWWIELQEAQTTDEVFQRIADQLRLHLQPRPSVRDQVCGLLRARQALLILDNTEQIPGAADAVKALLAAAPRLKCLVTSRTPLELQAEHLFEVPPLPVNDAQQLFADRARRRKADFALTPEISADVAELCRRLEGIPLAIELAASQIIGMTPRDMLNHLRARFRLLKTRAPDLPPRQRALRSAIDWSYELLTEDDRQLLAQLSVFAGGFTLEDAEAVCDAPDAFEGVMELRRQSLLRAETHGPLQQSRYSMLEAVREYAAEKLEASPVVEQEIRRRYAAYFLAFAERRASRVRTHDEVAALDEMGSAYDNLRAAQRWTLENRQGELCARLALALYPLLYRRGLWTEAQVILRTGLDALDSAECDARPLRAAIECDLAGMAHDMGDLEQARRLAAAGLALRESLADPAGSAEALSLLGAIATVSGELEAAQAYLEKARENCPDGDHALLGIILHNYALLARSQKRGDKAQQRYEEALVHRRAAGDARGEAETLGNLGTVAHLAGDRQRAKSFYLAALAIYQAQRSPYGIAVMLNNLAELAEVDGSMEAAITLYLHAEHIFRELQSADVRYPVESLRRLAGQFSAEAWAALTDKAAQTAWEELIGKFNV